MEQSTVPYPSDNEPQAESVQERQHNRKTRRRREAILRGFEKRRAMREAKRR